MLSFWYIGETVKEFCAYPSSVALLPKGGRQVGRCIDEQRRNKWASNPVRVKHVHGFNMFLNPEDLSVCSSIGTIGQYESHVTALFRKLLRRSRSIVDIGANVGWYTLQAAKILGKDASIIAFEPHPYNFQLLRKSLTYNNFDFVRAFQECVSDIDGTVPLYLGDDEDMGSHSTIKEDATSKSISVPSVRLDTVLSDTGIGEVDILKIDAQGAEPKVIEGARKSLASTRNILMEWNQQRWDQVHLLDELSALFDFYEIVRSPFLIRRVSVSSLFKKSNRYANLYLQRRSSVA